MVQKEKTDKKSASSDEEVVSKTPSASTSDSSKSSGKKKSGGSKDRNKRVREKAKRKLEEAKQRSQAQAEGLDTDEMVNDALARGWAGALKWVKRNHQTAEFIVGGVVLALVAYAAWDWHSERVVTQSSRAMARGLADEYGVVDPLDPSKHADETQQEKDARKRMLKLDPRPRFHSEKELRAKAITDYRKAWDQFGSTGPGVLARLGAAGEMLLRNDFEGTVRASKQVLGTELSKADEHVRMTATERLGLGLEGKGDAAGAAKAFKELQSSKLPYFQKLGRYHEARMALNKGNKEAAKKILVDLRKGLNGGDVIKSTDSFVFLKVQVDDLLRSIDPSLVPSTPNLQGGRITEAQIRALQEKLRKARASGKLRPKSGGGPMSQPVMPKPATPKPAATPSGPSGDKPKPTKAPTKKPAGASSGGK